MAKKARKFKRHKTVKRRKKAAARKIIRKVRKFIGQQAEPRKSVVSIEFCDKCGSIMVPVKKAKNTYLRCRRCGAEKRKDVKALKIVESAKKSKGVTILEKDTTLLPMVEMKCEKCNNAHAYFWLQQTRSADEPPTQFYRCTRCKYTWREYK